METQQNNPGEGPQSFDCLANVTNGTQCGAEEFMSVYTNWMTDSCCTSTTSTSPRPHLSRPPSRPPSETHKLHAHAHAAAHMHAAAAKLCFKAASAVSAAGASAVVAAAKVPKLPLSGVPASVGVDARHIAQQQVTPHSGASTARETVASSCASHPISPVTSLSPMSSAAQGESPKALVAACPTKALAAPGDATAAPRSFSTSRLTVLDISAAAVTAADGHVSPGAYKTKQQAADPGSALKQRASGEVPAASSNSSSSPSTSSSGSPVSHSSSSTHSDGSSGGGSTYTTPRPVHQSRACPASKLPCFSTNSATGSVRTAAEAIRVWEARMPTSRIPSLSSSAHSSASGGAASGAAASGAAAASASKSAGTDKPSAHRVLSSGGSSNYESVWDSDGGSISMPLPRGLGKSFLQAPSGSSRASRDVRSRPIHLMPSAASPKTAALINMYERYFASSNGGSSNSGSSSLQLSNSQQLPGSLSGGLVHSSSSSSSINLGMKPRPHPVTGLPMTPRSAAAADVLHASNPEDLMAAITAVAGVAAAMAAAAAASAAAAAVRAREAASAGGKFNGSGIKPAAASGKRQAGAASQASGGAGERSVVISLAPSSIPFLASKALFSKPVELIITEDAVYCAADTPRGHVVNNSSNRSSGSSGGSSSSGGGSLQPLAKSRRLVKRMVKAVRASAAASHLRKVVKKAESAAAKGAARTNVLFQRSVCYISELEVVERLEIAYCNLKALSIEYGEQLQAWTAVQREEAAQRFDVAYEALKKESLVLRDRAAEFYAHSRELLAASKAAQRFVAAVEKLKSVSAQGAGRAVVLFKRAAAFVIATRAAKRFVAAFEAAKSAASTQLELVHDSAAGQKLRESSAAAVGALEQRWLELHQSPRAVKALARAKSAYKSMKRRAKRTKSAGGAAREQQQQQQEEVKQQQQPPQKQQPEKPQQRPQPPKKVTPKQSPRQSPKARAAAEASANLNKVLEELRLAEAAAAAVLGPAHSDKVTAAVTAAKATAEVLMEAADRIGVAT